VRANKLSILGLTLAEMGVGWVVRRGAYSMAAWSGLLERRTPRSTWSELKRKADGAGWLAADVISEVLKDIWPVPPPEDLSGFDRVELERSFDALVRGKIRFFGGQLCEVGFPPRWHRDPETGAESPSDLHWSRIPDFTSFDIKRIWEASRFTWAFDLVRYHGKSMDPASTGVFWDLFSDWMKQNQPNCGPNWKCGQEAALRLIAVSFAAAHLGGKEGEPSERLEQIGLLAMATGRRIAANINYALNQHNNHGISEAVGLWLAGAICRGLPEAESWCAMGRELFNEQILALFSRDGAFSQYSVNYHRLAIEVSLVGVRLASVEGRLLGEGVEERLNAALFWLHMVIDESSGGSPRFGQWDGAHLFPLSACEVSDFRPVIQAGAALLRGERVLPAGPWDEQVIWLTGGDAACLEPRLLPPPSIWQDSTGYSIQRDAESMVFLRAGTFRFRPGQADLLHLDLWWRGINIAIDPGTFSYNAPEPWDNPLASTQFHNTVTIGGADQMLRSSRFLWLLRPESDCGFLVTGGRADLRAWEGFHDGFVRRGLGGIHRRAVVGLGQGRWVVVDRVDGVHPVEAVLHWLFEDQSHDWTPEVGELVLHPEPGNYRVRVATTGETPRVDLMVADRNSPRGWFAPTYGERRPAISLNATQVSDQPLFVTYLGPEEALVSCSEKSVTVKGDTWGLTVDLALVPEGRLLSRVHFQRKGIGDRTWEASCIAS